MLHSRLKRVEELLQQEIADIVQKLLKDPRIGFTTIHKVKVTKDLHTARVFVSFLEDDEAKIVASLQALRRAKGFIKKELSKRIVLKFMPDLHFQRDDTARQAIRIEKLLKRIKEKS